MAIFGVLLAVLVIAVLMVVWLLVRQKYTPEGLPIIGNIPWLGCGISLQKDGAYFIQRVRKNYGDSFQLYAGGKKLTFMLDDSFLPTFYKSTEEEMSFFDGINDKDSSFGLERILPSQGNIKKEEKQEYLSLRCLKTFLQSVTPTAAEFLEEQVRFILEKSIDSREGETVDLFDLMSYLVISMSSKILLSEELANDWDFIQMIDTYQKNALVAITNPPMLAKKETKIATELNHKVVAKIDSLVDKDPEHTFIYSMSELVYASTGRSAKEDTARLAFSYLFATIANTNAAGTHCLIEIITNNEVKQKVLEEIHTVIGNANRISQELLNKLHYLDACFTETLRLYAPPIHLRKCMIDIHDKSGKLLFPKGGFVCVSPYLRHREPQLYHDAEKFIPERHLKGKQPRMGFLTFGQGKHYCLGKSVAETEIKLAVCKLLQEYDIEIVNDCSSSHQSNRSLKWFTFGIILPGKPVQLRFQKKQK